MELGGDRVVVGAVGLVDRDQDRDRAAAQRPRQLGVAGAQPGAAVDDQHDRVGLGDRQPRLRLHVARQLGLVLEVDAAGVDQLEGDPVPLGGEPLAVAGDPRLGRGHRLAPADQPVDQRALADVGEADDGDGRQRLTTRSS